MTQNDPKTETLPVIKLAEMTEKPSGDFTRHFLMCIF